MERINKLFDLIFTGRLVWALHLSESLCKREGRWATHCNRQSACEIRLEFCGQAYMYYRLQKFATTFLYESSRQVGSTSSRPLGDAVSGGWSWTDQSRTKTPSAANLKATLAEKGVRELVQTIVQETQRDSTDVCRLSSNLGQTIALLTLTQIKAAIKGTLYSGFMIEGKWKGWTRLKCPLQYLWKEFGSEQAWHRTWNF